MSIKKIRKLAERSFSGNLMDRSVIDMISSKLTRKDLGLYIKNLGNIQRRKVIKVYTPSKSIVTDEMRKSLTNFFKKDLDIIVDTNLIAGLRIVDDDLVYELNLKDSLKNLIEHIQRTYD